MIPVEWLRHVPGCEGGEPPYSQELIGGGRQNRSFLVRTHRGRFVVRTHGATAGDPGLDRERELILHSAAADAGIAPPVVYAAPDRSAFVIEYIDGRLWTPHYLSRMRDLRSLAQRLRVLHGVSPPALPRFEPLMVAARYAEVIVAAEPDEADRLRPLLDQGAEWLAASGEQRRPSAIVHGDLHHGNVLTADRIYLIDWEYAQVGDPLLDLACVLSYYPRSEPHGALLLEASGMADAGATVPMLTALTQVFTLITYLWYRARRVTRTVPAIDLQLESAALRRLQTLAPAAQPRHTSAANFRGSTGAGNGNGEAAGD